MSRWNLKELRDFIRENDHRSDSSVELINAIGNIIDIFNYHLHTALTAFDNLIESNEASNPEHLAYILGATERQEDYEWAVLTSQANTISCIYTARSLYDVFSQLVRSQLLPEVPIEKCNIFTISKQLPTINLKECIDSLLAENSFKYVNAFSNVSKHRTLVAAGPLIDFSSNVAGVRFMEFEYRNMRFPNLWSKEVLEKSLEVKNGIVFAGIELNKQIISKQGINI